MGKLDLGKEHSWDRGHLQSRGRQPAGAAGPDPAPNTPGSSSVVQTGQVSQRPRQGLIVGGQNAAVGELPWQVAVFPACTSAAEP